MNQEKICRINELSRLARERELTAAEKEERQGLREEYLARWRRSVTNVLENTYVVDCEGDKKKIRRKPSSSEK